MRNVFRAMIVVWSGSLVWFATSGLLGEEPTLASLKPLPPQRLTPVTYEVDLAIVFTPPEHTKQVRVWLPIPKDDAGQEIRESRFETHPQQVEPRRGREPLYDNQFAYFEFNAPRGAQWVRHRFQARVWELQWQIDPERIETVDVWPESFAPYRRGDTQAVVVDERFERLLAEIVPQRERPLADWARVLNWVDEHFTYDHQQASLKADATQGLLHRRGHCSDYHSFCASLGRSLGLPTRIAYGLNTFPKNSPSHCKLEAYLAPYGWVSFDVSETQKLEQRIRSQAGLEPAEQARLVAAARRRLMSGFRDATWIKQTQGTDYELVPPASRRVAVVRTAWIEADGRPLPDPDPADPRQEAFAWMTVARFTSDRPVEYPWGDWKSLDKSSVVEAKP